MFVFQTFANMATDVCERIPSLLEEDRYQEALRVGKAEENQQVIKDESWDLVPNLCCPLTADNELYKPELIQTCEALLMYLAEICNPKELLLSLLEQVDCFKDDVKFIVLLQPIQRCLLRIPVKKSLSLSLSFQSIYPHLKTIEPPEWSNFEGKERLLLALEQNVERSNNVVRALIDFLRPFVEEMSLKNQTEESRKENRKQIKELVMFLLKILDRPLVYLDLTYNPGTEEKSKAKSTSRYLGERVVNLIHSLEADSLRLIRESLVENERIEAKQRRIEKREVETKEVDEMADFDIDDLVPVQGLATFAYLVFGENMVGDICPLVFTPECKLDQMFFALRLLLKSPYNLVAEKGVILLSNLVEHIKPSSLSGYILQQEDFKAFLKPLVDLICAGQVKEIARLAVKTLDKLYYCFTHQGRQRFFLYLFNTFHHAGFIGKTINLLQNELYKQFTSGKIDVHFQGKMLASLLKHVFALPSGEKSDLLENNDWILGALNLLTYVAMRDRANATGIWSQMDYIQKNYLETLLKGIQLSRAHYELSLEQLKAGKGGMVDLCVSVAGDDLPKMPRDQQKNVIEVSLCALDMMESVAARAGELIKQKKKEYEANQMDME